MWQWFNSWTTSWSGWIADSDLERALRSKLVTEGYYGDTAKFLSFRLVAVQRPGWLQVFSFSVNVRVAKSVESDREIVKLFGLVRQDERYSRTEIQLFRSVIDHNALYDLWTANLSRLRRPTL